MSALAETQARISSVRELKTVVGAMRGIAATHAQQARGALEGFRAYEEVIAHGLAQAVQLIETTPAAGAAPAAGPAALIIYSAEHGFSGSFCARVLDAARPVGEAELFIIGARGAALAEQRGWRAGWTAPMASQMSGVDATARAVADALYARFVEEGLARAEIVHARPSGTADFTVVRRPILPIDLAAFRRPAAGPPPLVNLPPARLVEQLVGEYVFAELALAALESFASENAARLATMESARVNIDQKLEELTGQERLQRQEEITAEVQDVVAGALASEAARSR